ncbi:MAG: transposase, partial [Oligoflexales bacterium]|nr:transposase [Oligoflexales bacterium]
VTNLQGADAKKIVSIYCRRWSVEVMFRELKSGMGLGQFEMIEEERKTQNAVGLAILSYQLVIILSKEKIKTDVKWSIFTLKHLHQKRFMKAQLESNTMSQVKRAMKIAV